MLNREMINSNIEKRSIVLVNQGREYDLNNEIDLEEVCRKYKMMEKFIKDEHKLNSNNAMPKSIQEMKRLELVDYEPASDSGHFRFYPKGALIFDLIKEWADEISLNRLNALKIETPLIYDYNEPDIKKQVESFHERHYVVNVPGKEREFILRFAGDFGLFKIMKTSKLSYKNLPLRVYEYSKSFRYEKSGELTGLKRLRAFSMPDIHSFAEDVEKGFEEYKEIYKNFYDLAGAMEIKFVPVFRAVESFYYEHKEHILDLVKYSNQPVYIELLSDMKHYWAIKSEFQAIDGNESFMQLSTVQLDIKDAEIYGISYVNKEGDKKGCIICHSSIGSIERWIYAILEASIMKEKAILPYWLSPVQIRLIPVSEEHLLHCQELSKILIENNIRVEIDDREERVGKRIRNSEQQWIPFVLVIGEKEVKNKEYALRERGKEEEALMNIDDIVKLLKNLQNSLPYKKCNLSRNLSKQPIFFG